MTIRAVGAAIGVLLMAGIVGLAIEVDERNGEEGGALLRPVVEREQQFEVIAEPPVIDGGRLDGVLRDPEFTPPTPPDLPPSMRSPQTIPGSQAVPVVPPPVMVAPAFPSPQPPDRTERQTSGADCGTPSGPDGQGAEAFMDGSTRITLRIDRCHIYDGQLLRPTAVVDGKGGAVVVKQVVFHYGDGTSRAGETFASDCSQGTSARQVPGAAHAYPSQDRTYNVWVDVTWAECQGGTEGEPRTATVSMPVHRHTG